MATRADIRRMVLTHLRVIDPEENPSPEQAQTLDLFIDGARAMLSEKGLCWWDVDDVPAAVSIPFRTYVAAHCCGDFGRAGKGYEAQEPAAMTAIASMKPSDELETVRAVYY